VISESKISGGLNALKPGWLDQADNDLIKMVEILDNMAKPDGAIDALAKQLHNLAHDLKGQAGTFGFTLLSAVAANLCHFLRKGVASLDLPVLRAHHAALKFVLSKRLEGDGGAAGKAILAKLAGLSTSGSP
jgi:hypothetical protein